MEMLNESIEQLRITCEQLHLNQNIFRFLSKPQRTVIVNFPVRRDSGKIEMFEGYRVLHSNVLGPGKGGTAIYDSASVEEVQALAMLMTWKTSLIGLPLGGSKGAIKTDPHKLSHSEQERLVRKYTTATMNVMGPQTDIPSPDLNTDSQTMAWMMDQYSTGIGKTTPGVVTGKPVEIGGILGRDRAVGWGLAAILKNFMEREAEEIKGKKIVVQGIGHVGRNFATTAVQYGVKVVGICDSLTGLYNEEGLDINDVIEYKNRKGNLIDYPRADSIKIDDLLLLKCDALLPCATANQITKDVAEKLQCRIVIEGANRPTTLEADQILAQRGIEIIPDIIANAGGLIASYFEWVQDISALSWSMDRVQRELNKIILNAFETVVRIKKEQAVTYRRAAYMTAIKRVASAVEYRGIYP